MLQVFHVVDDRDGAVDGDVGVLDVEHLSLLALVWVALEEGLPSSRP